MAFPDCSHFTIWHEHERLLIASNLFFIISTGISILPTIFMNVLTLVTIWRKQSYHSPSNIFICNLALSDLAVGVLAIPLTMAWKITEMTSNNNSIVCAVGYCATVIGTTTAGTSFLTLVAGTVDRYLALRYHLYNPNKVTASRVALVCIASWCLAFAVGLSFFSGNKVYELVNPILDVPSIALIVFCYYKIYMIARRHHNQIQAQVTTLSQQPTLPNMSRFKKTVSVLAYLSVVFFALYTPYVVLSVYQKVEGYTLFYFKAWNTSVAFIYISSAFNPIIYCWRFEQFRHAMKETFRISFYSKKKSTKVSVI